MKARNTALPSSLVALSFVAFASSPVHANTVWYVKAGGSGNQNGLSWANSMASIDAALTAASTTVDAQGHSDQIWVAEGKYFPPIAGGTSNGFAVTKPIEIYGGFKGTETSVAGRQGSFLLTILDGNINDVGQYTDNALHVVAVASVNYTIVIDGLLIRNGYATGTGLNGAGIECIRTNLNLANCFFQDNFAAPGANYGGGVYFSSANGGTYSSPAYVLNIKDSEFTYDKGYQGGAIYGDGIRGTLVNVKFTSCVSTDSGGAVCITKMSSSYPMGFTNCVFFSNLASGNGTTQAGGLYLGDIAGGGGTAGYAQIVNCTFAGNACNSSPAPNGQAIAMSSNSQATVDNSIAFWNNSGSGQYLPMEGAITASYSDIEGNWTYGASNHILNSDPLFVNLNGGNLSLQVSPIASPCIDAADYGKLSVDVLDVDRDGNTTEIIPWDITWVRRVFDQTTITDTGTGTYTYLDMGAYEIH